MTRYGIIENFIGGRFTESGAELLAVHSPLDGSLVGQVCLSGVGEVDQAVEAARSALPDWLM